MGVVAKRAGGSLEAGAPLRSTGDGPRAPAAGAVERWFDALDPDALPPRRALRWGLPALLLASAIASLALGRGPILGAAGPFVLACTALALLARGRRASAAGAARANRRGLALGGGRLAYHDRGGGAPIPLLDLEQPFGVTLLASPRRDRVVALLSSSAGAFYVGAAFDPVARRAFAAVVERATIVADDEVGLLALGPDGEPLQLAPEAFAELVAALRAVAPACQDRLFLTDGRRAPLALDGRELRAGGRVFDLGAPIEWRAFVFQEVIGQAVALYQGTWVRQGTSEVVLVCLLPAITPAPEGEGVPLSSLDRRALRDLRLMQGTPEDPPPADQRVAVDRLVMLPIRSALDKAPRAAAQPPRARA